MAVHARLKNEFTEDKKCHNLMRWLKQLTRCVLESLNVTILDVDKTIGWSDEKSMLLYDRQFFSVIVLSVPVSETVTFLRNN